MDLIPERLRGETATFDIKDKKGKVHRRGRPPHHRAPRQACWRKASGIKRSTSRPSTSRGQDSWPRTSSTRTPAKCFANANDEITAEIAR